MLNHVEDRHGVEGGEGARGTGMWSSMLDNSQEHLKEYYEIVDEARPLSGFFPTHADLFTEMHF